MQLRKAAGAAGDSLTGLVYRATLARITVALDTDAAGDDLAEPLALLKLVDETTHKRLRLGLNALRTGTLPLAAAQTGGSFVDAPGAAPGAIRDVAFGVAPPRLLHVPPRVGDAARLTDDEVLAEEKRMKAEAGLNAGQEEAIDFAMRCSPVACIHGPPGTGKSTTIVELIRRLVVLGGAKVLACAPSNVATDNLVERLAAASFDRPRTTKGRGKARERKQLRLVRIGHPARLHPSVLSHSLDVVIQSGDEKALANDVRRELDAMLSGPGRRAQRRADISALRKELIQREEAATAQAVRSADVVLCTCVGAVGWALKSVPEFDVVIIDEAAQALEAACWLPLLRGRRAVLAGDHLQLPPIVKSSSAAAEGFGRTLFDRLAKMHGDSILRMLTTQYRMNTNISNWASDQMYGGKLLAGDGVGERALCDLPGVMEADLTKAALMLIDTAGCNGCEETADEGGSKLNSGEAELVAAYLEELFSYCTCDSGFGLGDIGVIAPYNAQVACLRERLADHCQAGLEISTVDGFQGREKEVIILSMTRSNSHGDLGFLREDRRTNVAVTRARRQCVVIADSETVGTHSFLRTLLMHCSDVGMHRSAGEYGMYGGSSKRPSSSQRTQSATGGDHRRGSNQQSAGRVDDDESSQPKQPALSAPKLGIDETRAHFKPMLQSCFDPTGTGQIKFSSKLNAFERSVIHTLAEEFGLDHESFGDGADRYIRCSKPSTGSHSRQPDSNLEPEPSSLSPRVGLGRDEAAEHTAVQAVSAAASPELPTMTPAMSTEVSGNHMGTPTVPVETSESPLDLNLQHEALSGAEKKRLKRQRQKEAKQAAAAAAAAEAAAEAAKDDVDAVLASLGLPTKPGYCAFGASEGKQCKTKVGVIGQVCEHCKLRFCLTHAHAQK